MKKYVLLNPNAQWQEIKPEYLTKDVELIFYGTDKIPKRFSIPINYIDYNETTPEHIVKYTPLREEIPFVATEHINNYVDLQLSAERPGTYLEIRDHCLLFDTKMLRRFKRDNPEKRLVYRMNYPYDFMVNANSFFIRPEDLHYYEDIFDIIVFSGAHLYNIYSEASYPLDLTSLFLFQDDTPNVNNMMIAPSFARNRLTCKGSCWRGGSCKKCQRELALAAMTEEYFKK